MADDRAEPSDEAALESTAPVESQRDGKEGTENGADAPEAEVFADRSADGEQPSDADLSDVDPSEFESALDTLTTRLDALDDRVDGVQSNVDEKIDDVRSRVVQVKRETDEKAPNDHEHPQIRQAAARANADVESLERRVEALSETIDSELVEESETFEELFDRVDTLEQRLTTLARTTVDLRERMSRAESAAADRRALDEFLEAAHRNGVSRAVCADCGEAVHLGLLSSPTCPHCGASFAGVEPASWPFGSATLTIEAESETDTPLPLTDADV
ncbi:hypothetical protein [Haloprofundus salilacus]|uniref:hypothetical protein n=1 Tax=Haloprofundus salilacus TaxID=2876190 RepID=UPI001CC94491|nr:hypothetical protein [Haloprofundus salilacus]